MDGGTLKDHKPVFGTNMPVFLKTLAETKIEAALKTRIKLFNKIIDDYGLVATVFGVNAIVIPPEDVLNTIAKYADIENEETVNSEVTNDHIKQLHTYMFKFGKTSDAIPDKWFSYVRDDATKENMEFKATIKGETVDLSNGSDNMVVKHVVSFVGKNPNMVKHIYAAESTKKVKTGGNMAIGGAKIKDIQQLRDMIILAAKISNAEMVRLSVSIVNGFFVSIDGDNELTYLKFLKTGSPELSAFRILNFCAYNSVGRGIMQTWNGLTCDYKLVNVWNMQEYGKDADFDKFKQVVFQNNDVAISNYYNLSHNVDEICARGVDLIEYISFVYIMSGVEGNRESKFPSVDKFGIKDHYDPPQENLWARFLPEGDDSADMKMIEYLARLPK